MAGRVTIEVRAGKRYRVVARPVTARKREIRFIPASEARPVDANPDTQGVIAWRFYDNGAFISTKARRPDSSANDLVNTFVPVRMETGPTPTGGELARLRDEALRRAELPDTPHTYLYSDRPYYGEAVPLASTAEMSGYNLTMILRRAANIQAGLEQLVRTFGLQAGAEWCRRQRDPAQALTDWDALEFVLGPSTNRTAHAEWKERRDKLERVLLEKFDAATEARAQKDMCFVTQGIPSGLWSNQFVGTDVFHSFDLGNAGQFRVTRATAPSGTHEEVLLPMGEGCTTRVEAQLQPLRYRYLFRWTAVYVNIVFFAPPIISIEANNGIFMDRLPLDWQFPGTPESGLNLQSISGWIQQSSRYAIALQQDVGSQIISPYYYKILVGRVDGLWTIRQGDLIEDDLAAVLDVRRGEAAARDPLVAIADPNVKAEVDRSTTRFHVFRRTRVNRNEVTDWGGLFTSEIIPMSPSGPIYGNGGHDYSPL